MNLQMYFDDTSGLQPSAARLSDLPWPCFCLLRLASQLNLVQTFISPFLSVVYRWFACLFQARLMTTTKLRCISSLLVANWPGWPWLLWSVALRWRASNSLPGWGWTLGSSDIKHHRTYMIYRARNIATFSASVERWGRWICLANSPFAILGFDLLLTYDLLVIYNIYIHIWISARLSVCHSGFADIAIQKPPSGDYEPHVFTVFRTSNGAMTLSFVARDASGRTITDQSSGINLRPVTPGTNYGRRLENNSLPLAEQFEKPAEPGSRFLSSVASDPRRLSSRRRSFSSSLRRRTYTDSRRRTVSSPRRRVLTSPRRRTMLDTRRRTSIDDSRRRAAVVPSPRRRTYSSDGRRRSFSSYSNPSRPNMGQYGYANQHYAYQNYGGQMPMTTPYGYSGANAYQGSSGNGMKIAIAGGAGLLAGIAANKLMHHWGGYSQEQLMNAPCSRGWGMLGHEHWYGYDLHPHSHPLLGAVMDWIAPRLPLHVSIHSHNS